VSEKGEKFGDVLVSYHGGSWNISLWLVDGFHQDCSFLYQDQVIARVVNKMTLFFCKKDHIELFGSYI